MRRFLLGILLVGLLSTRLQAQGDVRISALAWAPNGLYLAIGTSDSVQVYNAEAESPVLLWQVETEQPVRTVLFNPSGEWLAAGLGSGTGLDTGLVLVWMMAVERGGTKVSASSSVSSV